MTKGVLGVCKAKANNLYSKDCSSDSMQQVAEVAGAASHDCVKYRSSNIGQGEKRRVFKNRDWYWFRAPWCDVNREGIRLDT